MSVRRKRFRIEEVNFGSMPMPAEIDGEPMPMHREIMTELRAIRDADGSAAQQRERR